MTRGPGIPSRTHGGVGRLVVATMMAGTLCAGAAPETPRQLPGSTIIPAERMGDWQPGVTVGVPGGIPTDRTNLIDVTKAPYNADNAGATDASAAIRAAIAAARGGDVVYLPEGTYRMEGGIGLDRSRSGITVRGAGMDKTKLIMLGQAGFSMGSGENYDWPKEMNRVTAGLTRGSTEITVEDASPFAAGGVLKMTIENDASIPVVSVAGFPGLRKQFFKITAKNGNVLTVRPPVYRDYPGASVKPAQLPTHSVGVEDLTLDGSGAKNGMMLRIENCSDSWIRNVKTRKATNYHVAIFDSFFMEMRGCYLDELDHVGSNGAGLLMNTVSASLIEDNIIYKAFPLIEINHGSAGNVIAYNYLADSGPGCALNVNHGPHNYFNLYEGNISPNLQADGYFGSVSDDTVFRNWFHGKRSADAKPSWCMSLNRFTRNYSVVGNLLAGPISCGNPNMGNGAYSGTAQPSKGKPWADLDPATGTTLKGVLTERTSDTAGKITLSSGSVQTGQAPFMSPGGWVMVGEVHGEVADVDTTPWQTKLPPVGAELTLWPGPGGCQELDLDVRATALIKGNFYASSGNIPEDESLGETALPDSLYLAAKPPWFGNLAWPPFDPRNPNRTSEAIPAGRRFKKEMKP